MATHPLIIDIQDGRFGQLLLEVRGEYLAKFDPRSANTDRQFLNVIMTSAVLMGTAILTAQLTPAERLELKKLYLDRMFEVCELVQKRKRELKTPRPH